VRSTEVEDDLRAAVVAVRQASADLTDMTHQLTELAKDHDRRFTDLADTQEVLDRKLKVVTRLVSVMLGLFIVYLVIIRAFGLFVVGR